jgi:hypothetical protein
MIMEQMPFIKKPEILNIFFKLNTEIEEIDLNWTKTDTTCYFHTPERKLKKRKSKKLNIDKRLKLKEAEIRHHPNVIM